MKHLSQHEEGEVAQSRAGRGQQHSLHQQQLTMRRAQLVHMVEHPPYSVRLQLHILSE